MPKEIIKSPLLAPIPKPAAALSPAPAAIGMPPLVSPAKPSNLAIFGRYISRLSFKAIANKSLR